MLSLSLFVDYLLTSGPARVTSARELLRPAPQRADFYQPLRDAIVAHHRHGRDGFDELVAATRDARKARVYPEAVVAYRRLMKRVRPRGWRPPPEAELRVGRFAVRIAPELCVEIEGADHVVKLYCRGEKLTAKRAATVAFVMGEALRGETISVLDVRHGRLVTPRPPEGAARERLRLWLHTERAGLAELLRLLATG